MISYKEAKTLILSALTVRPHTERELEHIYQWAETVKTEYEVLQCVLAGDLSVSMKDGECVFQVTDKGRKRVEKMGLV